MSSSKHYDGAGDGQCCALKSNGDGRCQNGVYGRNVCCGTHKNASNVRLAPDHSDRDWYHCRECGWQPADWERGGGGPPYCSSCGVEFGPGYTEWSDRDD